MPIYELADHIIKTFAAPPKYRFILLTNGRRSLTLNEIKNFSIDGLEADCQIWDIERIFTIYSSMQVREEITLDFTEYGEGIPCLRADNAVSDTYESFLCVMPAEMLVDIYDRYGSRLLENNVRAFLSTKVKVNKNIRSTILNEPEPSKVSTAVSGTRSIMTLPNSLHITMESLQQQLVLKQNTSMENC